MKMNLCKHCGESYDMDVPHICKRVMTDGSPVMEGHQELKEDGQQKEYIVLSEEERAKGFVRPYRDTYVHNPCGTATTMARSISETYARNPYFYSGTFCCGCGDHFPLDQFKWDDGDQLGS